MLKLTQVLNFKPPWPPTLEKKGFFVFGLLDPKSCIWGAKSNKKRYNRLNFNGFMSVKMKSNSGAGQHTAVLLDGPTTASL